MSSALILSNPNPNMERETEFELKHDVKVLAFFCYSHIKLSSKKNVETVVVNIRERREKDNERDPSLIRFVYESEASINKLVINIKSESVNKVFIQGNITEVLINYESTPANIEIWPPVDASGRKPSVTIRSEKKTKQPRNILLHDQGRKVQILSESDVSVIRVL